jgi:hypothetical protein
VAAVESMVKGHHGTVLKDLNVEKGELATKEKKTRVGTLQPALQVRVGSWVEISNPHPPRRQPARQTHRFAQPVINPNHHHIGGFPTQGKEEYIHARPPNPHMHMHEHPLE